MNVGGARKGSTKHGWASKVHPSWGLVSQSHAPSATQGRVWCPPYTLVVPVPNTGASNQIADLLNVTYNCCSRHGSYSTTVLQSMCLASYTASSLGPHRLHYSPSKRQPLKPSRHSEVAVDTVCRLALYLKQVYTPLPLFSSTPQARNSSFFIRLFMSLFEFNSGTF